MNKERVFRYIKRLIIAIIAALFCLFVLIVTQKFWCPQTPKYFSNLDWDGKDVNDIPEVHSMTYFFEANQGPYTVCINSRGFRDYEYSVVKDDNSIRIAAVGDSITFGAGINIEDTFVKKVEKLLQGSCAKKIEVLNFGACGASTINELELIERKVVHYNPDVVLLQMDPNDSSLASQIKEVDPFLNNIIIHLKNNSMELSGWLKHKLELYKYYRYRNEITSKDEYDNVINPLKEILAVCKKQGIFLVIISYDPVYRGDYYDSVLEYIRQEGVPLLDLKDTIFGSLPYEEKYINPTVDKNRHPLDAHPSVQGSIVIAGEIHDFLMNIPEFRYICER